MVSAKRMHGMPTTTAQNLAVLLFRRLARSMNSLKENPKEQVYAAGGVFASETKCCNVSGKHKDCSLANFQIHVPLELYQQLMKIKHRTRRVCRSSRSRQTTANAAKPECLNTCEQHIQRQFVRHRPAISACLPIDSLFQCEEGRSHRRCVPLEPRSRLELSPP